MAYSASPSRTRRRAGQAVSTRQGVPLGHRGNNLSAREKTDVSPHHAKHSEAHAGENRIRIQPAVTCTLCYIVAYCMIARFNLPYDFYLPGMEAPIKHSLSDTLMYATYTVGMFACGVPVLLSNSITARQAGAIGVAAAIAAGGAYVSGWSLEYAPLALLTASVAGIATLRVSHSRVLAMAALVCAVFVAFQLVFFLMVAGAIPHGGGIAEIPETEGYVLVTERTPDLWPASQRDLGMFASRDFGNSTTAAVSREKA